MTLRHHRRQYEQMSEFERETIIGIMEAVQSARRVARHLKRLDFIVTEGWGPVDRRDVIYTATRLRTPMEASCREHHHIIRHARVESTASITAVQTHAAPSLRAHVSYQTLARLLAERYLVLWGPFFTCASNNIHSPTPLFGVVSFTTRLDCDGMEPVLLVKMDCKKLNLAEEKRYMNDLPMGPSRTFQCFLEKFAYVKDRKFPEALIWSPQVVKNGREHGRQN
ncbi:HTH_Tnp_Tc3_2 domain-containing protein [Trichonephila clavipes]|nr:HTH_Tnp_Tc3_2 domain-containing protein [Trichonephila clavipes]